MSYFPESSYSVCVKSKKVLICKTFLLYFVSGFAIVYNHANITLGNPGGKAAVTQWIMALAAICPLAYFAGRGFLW